MLSYSAGRYVIGALDAQHARDAWNSAGGRITAVVARAPQRDGGSPIEPGTPIARLVIPSIDLDEIVLEGADELNAGPGHAAGSVLPGQLGNAVISGERDRHFSHLDAVAPGDTIFTESGVARETWIVLSKRIVRSDDRLVPGQSDPTLTLTTSWPICFVGPAPERLIVTAALVAPAAARVSTTH